MKLEHKIKKLWNNSKLKKLLNSEVLIIKGWTNQIINNKKFGTFSFYLIPSIEIYKDNWDVCYNNKLQTDYATSLSFSFGIFIFYFYLKFHYNFKNIE